MGAPYDDLMLADPSQPQGPADGSSLTPDQRAAPAAAVVGAPVPSMSDTLQSLLSPLYPEPPPDGLSPQDHANITALLGGPRPDPGARRGGPGQPGPDERPHQRHGPLAPASGRARRRARPLAVVGPGACCPRSNRALAGHRARCFISGGSGVGALSTLMLGKGLSGDASRRTMMAGAASTTTSSI